MLKERITSTLEGLARETYGNISPFTLEVHPKELRRNGDYHPATRLIRIFNLSRPTAHIIETAIHELAHHVDHMINGQCGHGPTFYTVLRDLNAAAIRKGVIKYQEINNGNNSRSQGVLDKKHGDTLKGQHALDVSDGKHLVKVFKAFAIKDSLKERKYRWSDLEVAWCKEIDSGEIDAERAFLENIHPTDQFTITESRNASIEAMYHVIVANAFSVFSQLKERGYLFNGYGYSGKVWVRRLPAQQLGEEKAFLEELACLNFKIEGRKSTSKPKGKGK